MGSACRGASSKSRAAPFPCSRAPSSPPCTGSKKPAPSTSSWQPSENNRRAKFYALTKAGRRRLGDETAQWNRIALAIGHALET